jgi:hypothetical protein
MKTLIGSGFGVFVFVLAAAQPVASVTSSSSFDLRGTSINTTGVPSWPLASGDDVATHAGSAVIELRDGSRFTLLPHSRALVEAAGGRYSVRLMSGSLRVGSISSSDVRVYASGEITKPASGQIVYVGFRSASPAARAIANDISLPPPVSRK